MLKGPSTTGKHGDAYIRDTCIIADGYITVLPQTGCGRGWHDDIFKIRVVGLRRKGSAKGNAGKKRNEFFHGRKGWIGMLDIMGRS